MHLLALVAATILCFDTHIDNNKLLSILLNLFEPLKASLLCHLEVRLLSTLVIMRVLVRQSVNQLTSPRMERSEVVCSWV